MSTLQKLRNSATLKPPRKLSRAGQTIAGLLAFAVCAGGAALLVRGSDAFSLPSAIRPFINPRSVDVAADGLTVVVDSGERRILGLESDGALRFTIKGENRSGGFYSGRIAGFDSFGRFYVDDTVLDLASSNTAARRCLRYDASGRFIDVVVSWEFEGDAMSDWEHHPIFMQVRNNALYWFMQSSDGVWALGSKPLLGDGPVTEHVLEGVVPYDFTDAVIGSPREAWFLAPDGTVVHVMSGEPPRTVYPAAGERGLNFPTALAMDARGRLLAADGKRAVFMFDPSLDPMVAVRVLDGDIVKRAGYTHALAFMDLSSDADGFLHMANEYTGEILAVGPSGIITAIPAATMTGASRAVQMAAFAMAWLAAAALAMVVVLSYYRIFKHRAPLVVKQVAIFVPLIAIMTISVAFFVYSSMVDPLEASVEQMLRNMSAIGASRIDPAAVDELRFDGLSLQEIHESPAYVHVMEVVDQLINVNEDPWNSNVFDYFYRKDGDSWWVIGSYDYLELYPYVKSEFEQVIATGEPVFLRYEDIYGEWLSTFSPVRGSNGMVVAIFEVTMSADVLDEASTSFAWRSAAGGASIIAGFLVVFVAFTAMLLRSIRSMKAGAERIACGDYDVDVDIRSRDEIQDLGDAFNSMSKEIRDYILRVTSLNEANARFVPAEFLAQLGKKDIAEIKLGDQAKADMIILFTDIRHFTDLSEGMRPAEVFAFLNDYLSRMGPEIREHEGFIDKYIGDAIMALFPGSVESALEAAYGMFARLDEINAIRARTGLASVEMGVGIHRGPVMIGIIGEAQRFDGTVISDSVNLASRLESLTKYYGVRAIVSETSLGALVDQDRYPSRFLDAVRVKGRQEVVRIRELLDRDGPGLSAAFIKAWEAAFADYSAGRFREAQAVYDDLLAWNPADSAARLFRDRCIRYLRQPPAAGWDGVTTFGEK